MSQNSQGGQVVLRTQTAKGAYPADMNAAGQAMRIRGGGLDSNRDLMIPDPEIGGGRDISDAYLGPVSWSGDLEFYARLEALLTLMNGASGTTVSAVAGGVNTHTTTPSDVAIPWVAIEERVGSSLEVFQYTDCKVNTLHLEAAADGYLMGTAGMIGARQLAGTVASPNPDWDTTPMIVGTNITVTYNGVTVSAKSFSLDLNNNAENDDFRLGSFYLGDIVPKRRELTVGLTLRPDDSALWRQAVYGTSSATSPGGVTTKQQVVITCTTYENIPASAPPTPYSLAITIPSAAIAPFNFGPSGDDVIQSDIEIRALRPNPATPLFTSVIKNGLAAVA